MNRTLVKVTPLQYCIELRTISRRRKSRRFLISRSAFARLETTPEIITRDIGSFAELHRDNSRDTLSIGFTWLSGSGDGITGYEETVTLRYSELADFIAAHPEESTERGFLALDPSIIPYPQLIFSGKENLHAAVSNGTIRHKLARFLRDNFHWPNTEQVILYNDFVPYSFFFREIRNGKPAMCGGVILHGQDNMSKAYYGMHT